MKNSLYLAIFICLSFSTNAQGVKDTIDPWNPRQTPQDVYDSQGLITSTGKSININGSAYTVFEDAENHEIKTQVGRDKKYYVLPNFFIKKVGAPIAIGTQFACSIHIGFKLPLKSEIAKRIQKLGIDPLVEQKDIGDLTVFGYRLFDALTENERLVRSIGGIQLNESSSLEAMLKFQTEANAQAFIANIENSGYLDFSILLNHQQILNQCLIDFNTNQLYSSNAWREYVSPSLGKTISVDQAADLKNNIQHAIQKELLCKGSNTGPLLEQYTNHVFNNLFPYGTQSMPFQQANNYLVDLNGVSFTPDEIRKLSASVSAEDYNEICNKTHSENNKESQASSTSKKNGKVSILKFKAGGDKSTTWSEKEKAFEKFLRDECKKSEEKRSMEFGFEGKILTPKNIKVLDAINSMDEYKRAFSSKFTNVISAYKVSTFKISK